MADQTSSSNTGGSTGLGILVGGLVVAVAVIGYVLFSGGADTSDDVSITVEGAGDAVESAAGAIEGAANEVEEAATGN